MNVAASAFNPHVPLHEQLYVLVKNEILDGLWAHADRFVGEHELADRYAVSVVTSRRVLERLLADGLISRGRGRPPQVTYKHLPASKMAASPIGPTRTDDPYTYEVLYSGIAPAPANACVTFGLPPGSRLWQLKRLRRLGGKAHSVAHNAQTPDLGMAHDPKKLNKQPMALLLAEEGVKFSRLVRQVGVVMPPLDVALALAITVQDATLLYSMTVFDRKRPVEWVRIYMHPSQPTPVETFDLMTHKWSGRNP